MERKKLTSTTSSDNYFDSLIDEFGTNPNNAAADYSLAQTPLAQDMLDSRTTRAINELTKAADDKEALGHISVHGWAHKQGKRIFKGPVHKSWKRRYFALEGSKFYYFLEPLDCRKYFTSRNPELVVGVLDLKDAYKLEPSQRMDLPFKGIEIHTKQRLWVLCPESESDYNVFFDALENLIITEGSGNVLIRDLPNVRVYKMKGQATYRFFYVLFVITAIIELAALGLWFPVGIQPCDLDLRSDTCADIQATKLKTIKCESGPFNGVYTPPDWYMWFAGVDSVQCFKPAPTGQWISYLLFYLAEFISVALAFLYYLGMWKPVRRGAQYLQDFKPSFPKEEWPTVDVLLCHYSEPSEDTIATLHHIMKMNYPSHLVHVWICDDGYCKSKWAPGASVPEVTVNRGVLENAGDVRLEVAQFMYDLVKSTDDMDITQWRKQHTTVNVPTADNPRIVSRADCAVGSVRDDYKYEGYFHLTFVGRIKPPVHHSKAGNINNVLYNEGANGKYAMILDNDMKPHEMFIQATLPFFFDDGMKRSFSCCATGCHQIAHISCSSCITAGVPEGRVSYCSRDCFQIAGHVTSSVHLRQTKRQRKATMSCMACGSKIDKKTGYCRKCKGHVQAVQEMTSKHESVLTINHGRYTDDIEFNQVGYVQTPQYFEDCLQLQLGDPCGHRNATFFDAAQIGMDGYEMASFAGTNAMFRRQALDSVNGIQYGSLTEDAFTGKMMVDRGWKGLYFRKDLEGEIEERIRLAEGAVPESVAASLAQRKRWAKGNFQIFLGNKRELIDPEWLRPVVEVPKKRKVNRFMKWVIFMNLTIYPIGSIPALFFFYIIGYFLYSGLAPIYTSGLRLLVALVPKLIIQAFLVALSTRAVENNDVVRSQQTWFSYACVHVLAIFEGFYWKITGKEASWANTGALGGNSPMELPNLLVFFAMAFGVLWAIVRFFAGYDNTVPSHNTPLVLASVFMGGFILEQLGPMVRMSIQEYFGWSHRSLTDHGNIVGSLNMAIVLSIICVWVLVEQPDSSIFT